MTTKRHILSVAVLFLLQGTVLAQGGPPVTPPGGSPIQPTVFTVTVDTTVDLLNCPDQCITITGQNFGDTDTPFPVVTLADNIALTVNSFDSSAQKINARLPQT
jgi:hypothetical protein